MDKVAKKYGYILERAPIPVNGVMVSETTWNRLCPCCVSV